MRYAIHGPHDVDPLSEVGMGGLQNLHFTSHMLPSFYVRAYVCLSIIGVVGGVMVFWVGGVERAIYY